MTIIIPTIIMDKSVIIAKIDKYMRDLPLSNRIFDNINDMHITEDVKLINFMQILDVCRLTGAVDYIKLGGVEVIPQLLDYNCINLPFIKQYDAPYKSKLDLMTAQLTAGIQMAESLMYTCPKCKYNKTSVYYLQLRSSDEPPTTFITCNACGFKWTINN